MTSLAEIKEAIQNLPPTEFAEIARWLQDVQEDQWDRQIEADVAAGRLDFFKEQVAQARADGTVGEL
ncbi:MAG: hypothetical protein OXK79_06540 [Chloroflexota bacterium]|nr:hypothetical protein [Chloroflexota bacterium]